MVCHNTVQISFVKSFAISTKLDLITYGCLNIVKRSTSWQMSLAFAWLGHRDNLRTIDQVCGILAEDCELRHLCLERGHHVVLILDVPLPIASGAWVYQLAVVNINHDRLGQNRRTSGNLVVGLEAHFTPESLRRGYFALVIPSAT